MTELVIFLCLASLCFFYFCCKLKLITKLEAFKNGQCKTNITRSTELFWAYDLHQRGIQNPGKHQRWSILQK